MWDRLWRTIRLLARAPRWKLADRRSRERFNHLFYREYAGLNRRWLEGQAESLFREFLQPRMFSGVPTLVEQNRREGIRPVLVTGSLDFAVAPVVRSLGFDEVLANSLEFRDDVATGHLVPPVLAGEEKVRQILRLCEQHGISPVLCRAYSDDTSDLPMLEAVGHPTAANPKPGLRVIAASRGWPILDLRGTA